jgi:hypothetical protein
MREIQKLSNFGRLFWFLDFKKLDLQKDKNLIIHQVLANGSLEDIRELISFYGKKEVKREFMRSGKRIYTPAVLKLVSFILDCEVENKNQYLKKIYANKI